MSFGSGRGALLKSLSESKSSNSFEDGSKKQDQKDSGLSFSENSTKSLGRGRTLELAASSNDQIASQSRGRGRSALFSSASTSSGRGSLIKLTEISTRGDQDPALTTELSSLSISEEKDKLKGDDVQNKKYEEPNLAPVVKMGTYGSRMSVVCNYIRLKSNPETGVFEYEVTYKPNVDSKNMRVKYLNEHRDFFGGTKTFDGVTLYLPIKLKENVTKLKSTNIADNSIIEINIIYKRKKPLKECVHLYNVLFDRIMKNLNYVRFDRKQYDPTAPKMIPQHKLEIWPGYVTAVDEYEGGVMLCCDVSHRILCSTTVLDILEEAYRANPSMFQENAKKALIGSIVLTRYNNKTYRIDDIDFKANPKTTFMVGDKKISFQEYYKAHYNIDINDLKQPLLTSIKKRRVNNKSTPEEIIFSLIPEICYLTGLTDHMRSNHIVMKDIATYTKVTPNQRVIALEKFTKNVNSNKDIKNILSGWGLTLDDQPLKMEGRYIGEESILFARNKVSAGPNADFGKFCGNNELLEVINFTNWLLLYSNNDSKIARSFMDFLEKTSGPMGIQVRKPKIITLKQDRTEEYVNALRNNIEPETQIVVIICPTNRDDRYNAIKKICCVEIPIASQVINARTLRNESKNRSIVQKIALQMNCKLGGTLWSIKIPLKNVMICGIDSYHDAAHKSNSVAAFVASLNNDFTKWYSRAIIQSQREEIVNGLKISLEKALCAYEKMNGVLPDKIIIYRDGVGDGQLKVVSEYEIPQLKESFSFTRKGYNPLFTYIVVQKRINTKIFVQNRELANPLPGFIVDNTITRKYLFDFFLVSQSVRQGTVNPCHFIVVDDTADHTPDVLQRLSYKLCFLYYNWPGTVKVPACCQYAHKLAYLVGQNVKRPTSEKLSNVLFYL